jgi:hypothetical protein
MLLGGEEKGCIRLFENSRDQHTDIVPHSHRYDFVCQVLAGRVWNRLWKSTIDENEEADYYEKSWLTYKGKPGKHETGHEEPTINRYMMYESVFDPGDWYSMTSTAIHSIKFSKDAVVLFFEGPSSAYSSCILQPVVDGEVIPTYKVEDWMFQRGISCT